MDLEHYSLFENEKLTNVIGANLNVNVARLPEKLRLALQEEIKVQIGLSGYPYKELNKLDIAINARFNYPK